ncbi:MAG: hypothetical protein RLZZ245_2301 [Verrucomicrobiota bacterium]
MRKNLDPKQGVSMVKMIQKLANLLFCILCSQIGYSADLGLKHAGAMSQLEIEKNFKGFSYGVANGDPNRMKIEVLPGGFEGKELKGIIASLSDDGKVVAIEPYFSKLDDAFEPVMWAFESYRKRKIGLNTLWEINRFSFGEEANDREVLSFVIHTIGTSDGYPSLDRIQIRQDIALLKAIHQIASDKKLQLNAEGLNLGQVKEALEL